MSLAARRASPRPRGHCRQGTRGFARRETSASPVRQAGSNLVGTGPFKSLDDVSALELVSQALDDHCRCADQALSSPKGQGVGLDRVGEDPMPHVGGGPRAVRVADAVRHGDHADDGSSGGWDVDAEGSRHLPPAGVFREAGVDCQRTSIPREPTAVLDVLYPDDDKTGPGLSNASRCAHLARRRSYRSQSMNAIFWGVR